jgi:hypothetical protein
MARTPRLLQMSRLSPPSNPTVPNSSGRRQASPHGIISYIISCPKCGQLYNSPALLRDHLQQEHTYYECLIHEQKLKKYHLFMCHSCTNTVLCLQQKGLHLHNKHHHTNPAHTGHARETNTFLITQTLDAIDDIPLWKEVVQWLPSAEIKPPPFRNSLYSKLPHQIKQQILDTLLQLLLIIQRATDHSTAHPDANTTPEYNDLSLLKLLYLFEAILLGPPTPTEPRQWRKLIPLRLHLWRTGHIRELYEQTYNTDTTTTPTKTHTFSHPPDINKQIETAIRNNDLRAAISKLDPLPRATMTPTNIKILHDMHPPPIDNTPYT